ncbi:MAG: hypothetical protein OXU61_02555 [Gammaproteobacteria bacterium]|nr:hypothetical protein [Gammaproteobacteria bacterium]
MGATLRTGGSRTRLARKVVPGRPSRRDLAARAAAPARLGLGGTRPGHSGPWNAGRSRC